MHIYPIMYLRGTIGFEGLGFGRVAIVLHAGFYSFLGAPIVRTVFWYCIQEDPDQTCNCKSIPVHVYIYTHIFIYPYILLCM